MRHDIFLLIFNLSTSKKRQLQGNNSYLPSICQVDQMLSKLPSIYFLQQFYSNITIIKNCTNRKIIHLLYKIVILYIGHDIRMQAH